MREKGLGFRVWGEGGSRGFGERREGGGRRRRDLIDTVEVKGGEERGKKNQNVRRGDDGNGTTNKNKNET